MYLELAQPDSFIFGNRLFEQTSATELFASATSILAGVSVFPTEKIATRIFKNEDEEYNNVNSFCEAEINNQIKDAGDAITLLADNFSKAVIPLVSAGTVTNLILTLLIVWQLFFVGESTKNRYLFLLCRATVDTITCLTMLIVLAHRRRNPNQGSFVKAADETEVFVPYGSPILSAFVQFNFWMLCSTYALLSLITFIAVRLPFFYRKWVTTRFCCILLFCSTLVGIGYSVLNYELGTTPFLTMELDRPQLLISYTPLGNPKLVLYIAIGNAIFILTIWIIVFAQYIGVLVILIRLRSKRSDNRYRAHWNSSLRLSLSILIWSLMCALMIAAVISPPLWNEKNTRWLNNYNNLTDPSNRVDLLCKEMASIATSLYALITVSVSAESLWLGRLVLDPFLCVCTDRHLRAFCAGNLKRFSTFRLSTEREPL
uniref:G_PROTEIN_RECEP_F1_2 domain-containing protein n=1 Tax=Syphacia muris TaxID=451379 RepID=A0A0N5AYV0_9BILA